MVLLNFFIFLPFRTVLIDKAGHMSRIVLSPLKGIWRHILSQVADEGYILNVSYPHSLYRWVGRFLSFRKWGLWGQPNDCSCLNNVVVVKVPFNTCPPYVHHITNSYAHQCILYCVLLVRVSWLIPETHQRFYKMRPWMSLPEVVSPDVSAWACISKFVCLSLYVPWA